MQTLINGQTANELDLDIKIAKINALIEKLKIGDKVELVKIAVKSETSDKTIYVVRLSNGEDVEFESTDEKSAKYRAYRIGRDGSKTRPAGLKVVSLSVKTN